MSDDPYLSYFGHPVLPAGFNSWEINGDEFDGPGVNEPVWPVLFDSFVSLEVLIITPQMLEVFKGCPDLVIGCDTWQVKIRDSVPRVIVKESA